MSNQTSACLAAALACVSLLASACSPAPQQNADEARRPVQVAEAQQAPAMPGTFTVAQVEETTRDWPEASRKAIKHMTDTYGAPAAIGAGMAIWGETGPWKRTVVFNREVPHDFPMAHVDVMQQWVNYQAPAEMYDDLARYDGSIVMERTSGEMSARCDKEAANFLAVNLAHDIATGKRSVDDARMEYGKQIKGLMAGEKSAYTGGVMFTQPAAAAAGFKDVPLAM